MPFGMSTRTLLNVARIRFVSFFSKSLADCLAFFTRYQYFHTTLTPLSAMCYRLWIYFYHPSYSNNKRKLFFHYLQIHICFFCVRNYYNFFSIHPSLRTAFLGWVVLQFFYTIVAITTLIAFYFVKKAHPSPIPFTIVGTSLARPLSFSCAFSNFHFPSSSFLGWVV